MTNAQKMDATEKKQKILDAHGYICEVCGGSVAKYGTPQLAHRIPATKFNLKEYGVDVIHHTLNMAPTCCLKCNDAVLIGTIPVAKENLLDEIYSAIDRGEK